MKAHHYTTTTSSSPRLHRRRSAPLVSLFVVLLSSHRAVSREWTGIELRHPPSQFFQHIRAEDLYEIDPFLQRHDTVVPSPSPYQRSPTRGGTPNDGDPNATPPTRIPFEPDLSHGDGTSSPSSSPLSLPLPSPLSSQLSSPSSSVVTTTLPDRERFPQNPVPPNPPRGYFNYDLTAASLYGPGYPSMVLGDNGFQIQYQNNAWKFVLHPIDSYWREFSSHGFGTWKGALASRQLDHNFCGSVGMQSPIDIRLSGVACIEHHQIRTLSGEFRVSGSSVDRRIEHNKLRLVWQRRPCADPLDGRCSEPDPPHADFPSGWGGFADALHVDFKLPSEHRIYGEVFDAEMQIYHLHPGRAKIPAISVLIRAVPGGHNAYLQTAIDAFQLEYDLHQAECADRIRDHRRLVTDFHRTIIHGDDNDDGTAATKLRSDHHYDHWAEYSTLLDDPEFLRRHEEHSRQLSSGIFDPYHADLIPTYWFFGYDGSLTEPPCTEIVSWYVMDQAMVISPQQLDQMKVILFTHVDPECQPTSTHFSGSVARPIQESWGRQVWRCTRDDFLPDHLSA